MGNRVRTGLRTRVGAVLIAAAMATSAMAFASVSAASAAPRADTKKPKVTIADMGLEAYNPVTVKGKATDNVGVKKVRIRLRRSDTNKYFNGSGWQTSPVWLKTKLSAPGTTSTRWAATVTLPKVFMFLEAQATDTSGKTSAIATTQFSVMAPPDLTVQSLTSNPAPFEQGTSGMVIVSIYNVGVAEYRRNVTLTVTFPDSLTVTSNTTPAGWSCTLATHVATCRFTDPVPGGGGTPSIGVSVDVASDAPSPVTVTATITAAAQARPGNDSKSVDFEVVRPD